jgi:hypothetical protein
MSSRQAAELLADLTHVHWHQRFELARGVWTPGRNPIVDLMNWAGVRAVLRGKTVLDIGTWNGGAAFEAERRGDIYHLLPDNVGRFDYVFLFGVLYHCRHPLLALDRTWALTNEVLFLESRSSTATSSSTVAYISSSTWTKGFCEPGSSSSIGTTNSWGIPRTGSHQASRRLATGFGRPAFSRS